MSGISLVAAGVAVVLVLVLFAVVKIYNRLVALRQSTREGWSGIDVQLKRRANLIPNIVETVKGYASHEKNLFEEVTRLRAETGMIASDDAAGRQVVEGQLSNALMRIFAVAENYPELRADKTFIELQSTLAELEDQIQMVRRYYNGTVRDLNISVETFPNNIIANMFGFATEEYYEVEQVIDKAVPDVKFN
ncbi:LemA family protein [Thalassospira alkalitolerans]|uniref:LemA family protein n=1 Tax=Thalassospira alkalitolerans TaxID=1293890 RepID=UPI001FE6FAB2|nr:LemA family protein [Thalassospira alkalitolerans]